MWRVVLPLFIAKSLEEGVGVYGLATFFLGVASLLTSLIVELLSEKYIIFKFSLGVFIWEVGLLIIGMFPHTLVLYVAAILVGVGQSVEGLTRSIAIQTKTPNHLMGKVFSLSSTSNYAADTLSLGVISLVIPLITLGGVFTSGGVIIALLSFIGIRYSSK